MIVKRILSYQQFVRIFVVIVDEKSKKGNNKPKQTSQIGHNIIQFAPLLNVFHFVGAHLDHHLPK